MNNESDYQGDGEKNLTILSMVVAKAWKDSGYKDRLLKDPASVIAEEGLSFPPDVKVKFLENTDTVRYLPLSRNIDPGKDVDQLTPVLSKLLPIPEGTELRLVQSTEDTRYLVLPVPPPNVDVNAASAEELRGAVADGVTVTTTNVVQTNISQVTVVLDGGIALATVVLEGGEIATTTVVVLT